MKTQLNGGTEFLPLPDLLQWLEQNHKTGNLLIDCSTEQGMGLYFEDGNIIFVEWEMTISFKKRPSTIMYGASRLTLDEAGKIAFQKDYYDLWGDIFDNIPRFNKMYRKFMHRKFG